MSTREEQELAAQLAEALSAYRIVRDALKALAIEAHSPGSARHMRARADGRAALIRAQEFVSHE